MGILTLEDSKIFECSRLGWQGDLLQQNFWNVENSLRPQKVLWTLHTVCVAHLIHAIHEHGFLLCRANTYSSLFGGATEASEAYGFGLAQPPSVTKSGYSRLNSSEGREWHKWTVTVVGCWWSYEPAEFSIIVANTFLRFMTSPHIFFYQFHQVSMTQKFADLTCHMPCHAINTAKAPPTPSMVCHKRLLACPCPHTRPGPSTRKSLPILWEPAGGPEG